MDPANPRTVTRLLQKARAGENDAAEALLSVVHDDLRDLAAGIFARERGGHTLQPTALLHEAWMKIAGHLDQVEDRIHFFAIASTAMRRVLVDHARACRRQKRGGDNKRITLDERLGWVNRDSVDLVDLDDSLSRLATLNERHARVVELRILGGLTVEEVATFLGVSRSTVENDWFSAKSWLRTELSAAS